MTVAEFLAADPADILDDRIAEDDVALYDAFELATENDGHDGAERLKRWAVEAYS
jgi:hypothetical protein